MRIGKWKDFLFFHKQGAWNHDLHSEWTMLLCRMGKAQVTSLEAVPLWVPSSSPVLGQLFLWVLQPPPLSLQRAAAKVIFLSHGSGYITFPLPPTNPFPDSICFHIFFSQLVLTFKALHTVVPSQILFPSTVVHALIHMHTWSMLFLSLSS